VFEVLPPALAERPTNNALSDAEINIQAFVFNMFAGLDNLAWILVKEKGLPIPKHGVGLGENKEVRHYLSNEFQDYLTGLNDWFNYLKKFRDALAHRIPLYIPLGIPNDKVEVYLHLGDRIKEATQQRDVAEARRLFSERISLPVFIPIVTHSIEDGAEHIQLHPQLLTDFGTIEAIAQRMLKEIDR
jgi:hypothetical protein